VKVKEPQEPEIALLEPRHALLSHLHLAHDAALTRRLADSEATCIAYETVEDGHGRLPLLAPMSEVAGKIAAQAGAFMPKKQSGGRGVLLGGVPGVRPGRVVIIGGGVVGLNAALIAVGLGADVLALGHSLERLRELDLVFGNRCSTVYASRLSVELALAEADLVVGAVLLHGARAPRVVSRAKLRLMKQSAVLVDVSIDEGGCFATSGPTTHSMPTYEVDGVVHYCVTNMPGVVPATSAHALTNATLLYMLALADHGLERAVASDKGLLRGVNVAAGHVTYEPVAREHGLPFVPARDALATAAR
jgi:alanine dehydrogenase